jgi:hypothetical protein
VISLCQRLRECKLLNMRYSSGLLCYALVVNDLDAAMLELLQINTDLGEKMGVLQLQ